MKALIRIGIATNTAEVTELEKKAQDWIYKEQGRRHPLDLFGVESALLEKEITDTGQFLSYINNITIDGANLLLDRVFDSVGFNRIEYSVFRRLVKARLSYPTSEAATVEYLKNHFDEDVSLSRIYRYRDKLSDSQHNSSGHKRALHHENPGWHIRYFLSTIIEYLSY